MSLPKAIGKATIPDAELKADRKKAKHYDQCGLGAKAIYMGGGMMPRSHYIPYGEVTHVYRRVAESQASGKGLLAPILYLVVRYGDGQEYQTSFHYLQDADKMLEDLKEHHPEISLLSPAGEEKVRRKEEAEKEIQNRVLSEEAAQAKDELESARRFLEKRPSLYEHMVSAAKMKRRRDLVKPGYEIAAGLMLALGFVLLAAGIWLILHGGVGGTVIILILLFGAMLVFLMLNSKILPNRKTTRKALQREYETAREDMARSLRQQTDFPVPAVYAHPYVLDRMIRILEEGRAENTADALNVLKNDLRGMDSSVALSGDDYRQVVTIKPLFLVNDYQ